MKGECWLSLWWSLSVTVRSSGATAPGGPRVASRGAPALSELLLLLATPRRLAVSAPRLHVAR